jgi:hypothetical protein
MTGNVPIDSAQLIEPRNVAIEDDRHLESPLPLPYPTV